jgi:hypothetical protein
MYVLYIVVCPFVLFLVLSVLLIYTDSDYPFGIFKLFFLHKPVSIGREESAQLESEVCKRYAVHNQQTPFFERMAPFRKDTMSYLFTAYLGKWINVIL